jgi:hypothetical protein
MPIILLSFCLFRKYVYAEIMTPVVRKLKFATFGHDLDALHQIDIRKKSGDSGKWLIFLYNCRQR